MNLTDVDDRIIKEAGDRGITIQELVAPFITAFYEDRDYLRITPAHSYPRATEFVEPMVRLVRGLLANGTAYQGEDGSVYFAIGRFPRIRPALPARQARAQGRSQRTGLQRRVRQGERPRLRALEGGQAGGRGRLGRVGRALRPGASGLAPGVLGHGARADRTNATARRSWTSIPAGWTSSSRTTRTRSPRAAPLPARPNLRGSGCTPSS